MFTKKGLLYISLISKFKESSIVLSKASAVTSALELSINSEYVFLVFASFVLSIIPLSPSEKCITIAAKRSNTTIVITSAISVIPFLGLFFSL